MAWQEVTKKMNDNSKVITILCSHLCVGEGVEPFTPKEWENAAKRLSEAGKEPKDLFEMRDSEIEEAFCTDIGGVKRIRRLLDRSASLAFEIEEYENVGINIITRADREYPKNLKRKLGSKCPPLFYVAGDMSICESASIGFVGSRNIDESEMHLTKTLAAEAVRKGYTVVSGGAKGVDQVALMEARIQGGKTIIYAADSMSRKLRDKELVKSIKEGNSVLLSVATPEAGFNTGIAMMRNKYIYAQSEATVVIKSDFEKGGTWAGASEALKYSLCKVCCNDNKKFKGNQALIQKGAVPITSNWDFDFGTLVAKTKLDEGEKPFEGVQIDFLSANGMSILGGMASTVNEENIFDKADESLVIKKE